MVEGVLLMAIGMGFVFVFLVVLTIIITVLERIYRMRSLSELESIQRAEKAKREKRSGMGIDDGALVAAIFVARQLRLTEGGKEKSK